MALEIRRAGEGDIAAVRELLRRTWHATYDRVYGAERVREIIEKWHSDRALMTSFARSDAVSLVALLDGEVVGHAFAALGENGALILHRLYILPERQGSGVGSALLAAVIAAFPQAEVMSLRVERENRAAVRFYEGKGFRGVRTETGGLGGVRPVSVLIMERPTREAGERSGERSGS